MKAALLGLGRAIAAACVWVFDSLYGLVLGLLRLLHLGWSSRLARGTLRLGLRTLRVSAWTLLVSGACLGAGWVCFARVPVGFAGVRQRNFGGAGLDRHDTSPGLVFCVKGLHTLHLVESCTRVLAFAWETEGGDWPALDVRTRDGNMVNVSVAIPYHVRRGEAHQLVAEGLKLGYPLRVKAAAEKLLLEELGVLSSEELMSTELRSARVQSTLERLQPALAQFHVQAEAVLVTQVLFAGEYEKKLQQKQLTAQEAKLHHAAAGVEESKKEVELHQARIDGAVKALLAEWDRRIQERYAEGQGLISAVQSEARFYDKTRRAEAEALANRELLEGERAVALAEALKQELANRTYGTEGGRLMLARQAAENLNIRQVTLNSNDPRVPSVLDLDELAHRLLGGGIGPPQP